MAQEMRSNFSVMNAEVKDILNFLKAYGRVYVSVVEISRRLGVRGRKFQTDRAWARPELMRMERDGLLESNEYGEFRIRNRPEDTNFLEAMSQADPKVPLGDTTIIRCGESDDQAKMAA